MAEGGVEGGADDEDVGVLARPLDDLAAERTAGDRLVRDDEDPVPSVAAA